MAERVIPIDQAIDSTEWDEPVGQGFGQSTKGAVTPIESAIEELSFEGDKEETPGIMRQTGRGLVHGTLGLAEAIGTGTQYVGSKTGIKPLEELGREAHEFWSEKQKPFEPTKGIEGSIIEKPSLLLKPSWWAYNVADMIPSMASTILPGVGAMKYIKIGGQALKWTPKVIERLARIGAAATGGAIGGAQEGASTYQEVLKRGGTKEEAERAMELMGLASAGLNAISLDRILKPGKFLSAKNFLVKGGVESLTEYAEEPAEVLIKRGLLSDEQFPLAEAYDQLKQGANVIGPTFITGGVGGTIGSLAGRTETASERSNLNVLPEAFFEESRNNLDSGTIRLEDLHEFRTQYAAQPNADSSSLAHLDEFIKAYQEKEALKTRPAAEPQGPLGRALTVIPEQPGLIPGGRTIGHGVRDIAAGWVTPGAGGVVKGQRLIQDRKLDEIIDSWKANYPKETQPKGEPYAFTQRTQPKSDLGQYPGAGEQFQREGINREFAPGEREGGSKAGGGDQLAESREREEQIENEGYPELRQRKEEVEKVIDQAAHEAATSPLNDLPEPTEAQKEAGNYRKGHISLHGLDISIENPKGSIRSGTSKAGKTWQTEMQDHYGQILGYRGVDKDHVDVFVGKEPESEHVFVVNQADPETGKFDEHKVMIGYPDEATAKESYLRNYEKGWKGLESIVPMSTEQFKGWLESGGAKKGKAKRTIEAGQSKATGPDELASSPPASKKEAWEMTREETVWGKNIIPDGSSTDRALKGRLARWEKIQKDPQYTRSEAVERAIATEQDRIARADAHRVAIQQALSEGKPVPPEVLADYPDLQTPERTGANRIEPDRTGENRREPEASSSQTLATWVKESLTKGSAINKEDLHARASTIFGGSMAEGKYAGKDAFDALEMGINQYVRQRSDESLTTFNPGAADTEFAQRNIDELRNAILDKIPSQQGLRTEEQDEFQQFSTPPDLAFAMAWVAKITDKDTVFEPSAGIGGLAVFAKNTGAKTIVNELSPRRAAILKQMGFDEVYTENAEQIFNILGKKVKPTVVLMNPPFSATAGRIKGQRKSGNVVVHLAQALKTLQPGGRMVALIGKGWYDDPRAVSDYFTRLKRDYSFRAIINVGGKGYAKYGTTFDNRILVIDKVPPQNVRTLEASVEDVKDAIPLLKEVRDVRTPIPEQSTSQPEGQSVSPGREATSGSVSPVLPATGEVGTRRGRVESPISDRGNIESNAPLETREGNGPSREVKPSQPSRTFQPSEWPEGSERPRVDGTRQASGDVVSEPGPDEATGQGLTLERKTVERKTGKLSDSVYESYTPQKVNIRNAKAHPGKLVESAAMAVVEPPDPTYSPNMPEHVVKNGKLSLAQLEAIVYAGQAHQEMTSTPVLDDNGQPTDRLYRKGYFIGDGTGVGKGREISGILWDNWRQGRKRAIWVSQNAPLIEDAKRDTKGIGWTPDVIFDLSKQKIANAIQRTDGVAFLGYDLLKSKDKKNDKNSRLSQLVNWFGKDFDGVIVFDESHNLGNALAVKGTRGTSKPSAKALAGVELQRLLPNARVVYVSATGATEVMNLSYADRLGLWGEGTEFPTKHSFVTQISSGGIAAMEFVARDMKALGNYLSRSLSYEDVKYDRLQHNLTPEQRGVYDELARAWQMVLGRINEALDDDHTQGAHNANAKSAAMSAFWGSLQRFFNQIITSMQTPAVVNAMEQDLANGHAVILQIVNTNEAATERALAKLEEDQDLEDLDLTPRDQFMQYVANSFPVAQYEQVQDPNDPDKTIWVPVVDSNGMPVENPDAVEMREELLNRLGSIKVPDGPLEIILDHFGVDKVAEITGRQRRVVYVEDEKGRHKAIEKRSQHKAMADADAFMADKKPILIFSYAGGTGRSYHADLAAKNQRLRRHYLLQAGWRADRAIQGFGRSHRSSQKQAPEYILVTTDIIGQKRFMSSIARRLDQLGALTKGQRETGSGGFFTARDNLESTYAQDAITRLIQDIYNHQVPNWTIGDFIQQTGLTRLIDPRDGSLNLEAMPPVTQFLNRLLAMELDKQAEVFELFSKRLDANIRIAMAQGTLDVGLETMRAKKITKAGEQAVHTDEKSGAQTKYVQLNVTRDAVLYGFDDIPVSWHAEGFFKNIKSGQVWAASQSKTETNPRTGELTTIHRLRGPKGTPHEVTREDLENTEKYERLRTREAEKLWTAEHEKLPKEITYQEHLVTGALLPIWTRIDGKARIMRVQTDEGERMIGRLIDPSRLTETLRKIGATASQQTYTPADVLSMVKDQNFTVELANGWNIKRAKVAGEPRIELVGPDWQFMDELKHHGVFVERVQYTTRFFIPASEQGIETIKAITKNRPVVNALAPLSAREDLGHQKPSFLLFSASGLSTSPRVLNKPFSDRLDKYLSGAMGKQVAIKVTDTPVVLELLGARKLPVIITDGTIEKDTKSKHSVSIDALRQLPAHLHDPIAVFDSGSRENSFVIMTELQDAKGDTIIAAIHLEKEYGRYKVNEIASVYGKNRNAWFSEQIEKDRLRYIDEKRASDWAVTRGLQLPTVRGSNRGSKTSILTKDDLVKAIQQRSQGPAVFRQADLSTPSHRLAYPKQPKHTVEEVRGFIGPVLSRLNNAGNIEVVENWHDLPVDLVERSGGLKEGEQIFGVYDPGPDTTYIFADAIDSAADARVVLLHEVIGHRGIDTILNDAQRQTVYKGIHVAYTDTAMGRQVIKDYGLDLSKEEDRETFSREIIAHMAETGEKPGLWDRIAAIVRMAIRRLGIDLKYSDADIKGLISKSYAFAKNVEVSAPGEGAQAFSFIKQGEERGRALGRRIIEETRNWQRAFSDFQKHQVKGNLLPLGSAPAPLKLLNVKDLPVAITRSKLADVMNEHSIGEHAFNNLPRHLADPLMILDSATHPKVSVVIVTELVDEKGRPIVVPIYINQRHGHYEINAVGSIYGHEDGTNWPAKQIREGRLRYIDKERASRWFQAAGLQLPLEEIIRSSKHRIYTEKDVVKPIIEGERKPLFKKQSPNPYADLPPALAKFLSDAWKNKTGLGSEKNKETPPPPPSSDPQETRAWLRREWEAAFNTFVRKDKSTDLSFLRKILSSPEYWDHPVLSKIVRIFVRDRSEFYHRLFWGLDNPDKKAPSVTQATRELRKNNPEGYKQLAWAIDYGDTQWKRDRRKTLDEQVTAYEAFLRNKGLNDEVIDVWKLHRESYDDALDLMTAQMRQLIEELQEKAKTQLFVPQDLNTLQNLRLALASMEEWRGFYAPRMREPGNYVLQASRVRKERLVTKPFAFDKGSSKNEWHFSIRPKGLFEEWITATPDTAGNYGLPSVEGINYVMGKDKETGQWQLQSIRFKKDVFDVEGKAKEWWDKNRDGIDAEREFIREHGGKYRLNRRAEELKAQGWSVHEVQKIERLGEDVYQNLKTVDMAKAIDFALKGLREGTEGPEAAQLALGFNEEVIELVSNLIKARGYRSSMIHRGSGEGVVRGYIEDPQERHVRYLNSVSGGISKARVAQMAMIELLGEYDEKGERVGGIDQIKEPRAYAAAQEYVKEQLRNIEPVDRAIGIAKSIASFKYLGFNLRSLAVNLTAIATTAPAAIHEYALGGKADFIRINRALAKAGKDYAMFMAGRKVDDETQEICETIKKEGWDDAQYVRDAQGELQKAHHQIWSKAMEGAMWMFKESEQWNRGTTVLAAYRLVRTQDKTKAQALDLAKEASDKAHGIYGKATLPSWAQGPHIAAKAGQMMYVYSKFGHNYVQMLYDLGFKKHNISAMAWAIAAPVILAGGAALPFKDEMTWIINGILRALGWPGDIERFVWDAVRRYFGSTVETAGRHGLTGLAGVDISGSVSVGIGIPSGFVDLSGAIGGVAEDIWKAGHYLRTGQPGRAGEKVLPRFAENVAKAVRERVTGATTEKGRRIWDIEGRPFVPSAAQTGMRVLGFRSAEQAVLSEQKQEAIRVSETFKGKRDKIYEEYRAHIASPKRQLGRREDIMKDVREYNNQVIDSGLKGEIPLITSEGLRRQRKGMNRPPKKEQARFRHMSQDVRFRAMGNKG